MDGKDYYQVLGVARTAGGDEIRRRYLALAKEHHPDHSGDTQQMMLLNAAYETLSNPQTRFLYNNQLDDQAVADAVAADDLYRAEDTPPRPRHAPEKQPHVRRPAAQPQARRTRPPQQRSWAGRIMSFVTAMAAILIVGATIAGHLPKTGTVNAFNLSPSTTDSSTGTNTGGTATTDATAGTDTENTNGDVSADSPAGMGVAQTAAPDTSSTADPDMPVDGTLQPRTPAETHYRCTLHYIASYKRMNCN
jgi:curved DNA-binding protein CbpA